jgi:xanthine dehydrogenase small subunit
MLKFMDVFGRWKAASLNQLEEARVALGAAAMVPVRARTVEAALAGKAADEKAFREAASLVLNAIDPIADFRGSAEYKQKMAVVHVIPAAC